jgi:uncharacterized membrane protein (UPF0127 family)
MKIKKIRIKGKVIEAKICDNLFSQAIGLMFKKKSMPLFFIFKNSRMRAIHSFFCKPFVAVWFDKDKVIDVKVIKKWKFSIKPKKNFDKLLEIPEGDVTFKEFLDEEKV